MWHKEFNKRNYPLAYFDKNLREHARGYAVDTCVCFKALESEYLDGVARWIYEGAAITLYPPILHELFGVAKQRRKKLRRLLNKPNVRFVVGRDVTSGAYKNLSEELKRMITAGEISKTDAVLIELAKYEDATIVSFDNALNEAAVLCDAPLRDMRIEKSLPLEFRWSWKRYLSKNTKNRGAKRKRAS